MPVVTMIVKIDGETYEEIRGDVASEDSAFYLAKGLVLLYREWVKVYGGYPVDTIRPEGG